MLLRLPPLCYPYVLFHLSYPTPAPLTSFSAKVPFPSSGTCLRKRFCPPSTFHCPMAARSVFLAPTAVCSVLTTSPKRSTAMSCPTTNSPITFSEQAPFSAPRAALYIPRPLSSSSPVPPLSLSYLAPKHLALIFGTCNYRLQSRREFSPSPPPLSSTPLLVLYMPLCMYRRCTICMLSPGAGVLEPPGLRLAPSAPVCPPGTTSPCGSPLAPLRSSWFHMRVDIAQQQGRAQCLARP